MKMSGVKDRTGYQMLHYCLAHLAYHFSRQLPRRNRTKLQVLLVLLVTVFLFPQMFVLARPRSSRYCDQPLLYNLTTFIIFTFIMTGFTFLLTLMDPVPRELKVAFHAFGVGSFLQGIITTAFTIAAPECVNTTPELYHLSLVLSVLSMLATVFVILLIPFWLVNSVYRGMLLNTGSQAGICHRPVADCPCLWYFEN
ncbi:uncharacterized protein [Mobula birostris]|uniref:uncharacterized protein isoform X1 n=2 Tax=Mobula birostris TaxID=1983395 RepID=UPI003B27C356